MEGSKVTRNSLEAFEGSDNGVVLGGRKRRFFLSMKGMKYLSGKYGSMTKAIGALRSMPDNEINEDVLNVVGDLVVACLLHEDKTISLDDVEDWLGPGNLKSVLSALVNEIRTSMPQSEGKSMDPTEAGEAKKE